MRIYISYDKEDQPQCVQIAEHLEFHQVRFSHNTNHSNSDGLEWCHSVIFLVSRNSVNSPNCIREIKMAQQLRKHIVQIAIEPNIPTLEFINSSRQFILDDGLDAVVVREILTTLAEIEEETTPTMDASQSLSQDNSQITTNQLLHEAVHAMKEADFAHAVICLTQIMERDDQPKYINTKQLLKEAKIAQDHQVQQRKMQLEYLQIVELFKLSVTRSVGIQAFKDFRKANPNYDPNNLSAFIEPQEEAFEEQLTFLQYATDRTRKIPLLEWCEIPEGNVHLTTKDGNRTLFVNDFLMARYPVTNKQYQAFIIAPNGYSDPYWWEFSENAWKWRIDNPDPTEPTFNGHDRPRENVNWYEAIAFCRWLSEMTNLEITLPTLNQRRRAIMGEDGREYPWGNTFDQSRCNTHEQGLRVTTSVNRYKQGVSQYGVYDLVGNVWEWCLDRAPSDKKGDTVIEKAYVHGGSWMGPYDRCHVNSISAPPKLTAYAAIGFRIICTKAR